MADRQGRRPDAEKEHLRPAAQASLGLEEIDEAAHEIIRRAAAQVQRAQTAGSSRRDQSLETDEEKKATPLFDRSGFAAIAALVGVAVTGAFSLGAVAMEHHLAQPTTETVSVCVVAQKNVKTSLDLGISRPEQLRRVNPAATDQECGDEVALACDILDGNGSSVPAANLPTYRQLGC